ncbi:hypothetical protein B0H11DRAFT_2073459 [Mycena galericulata]|nr:hypothetical protein B0H11DRAFT_2073459 [Mycena galericulata]
MSDPATSPAVSFDHDNDDSRVYFGPFKSPEKKYLGAGLAVTQPFAPSPLRRSPRLSSPIPIPPGQLGDPDEEEDPLEDEDEDLSRSRSGTPDNDRWQQDEPSSVLATRITRAHDNPSPPPTAPVQDLDSAPPTPERYPTQPIPFIIPDSPSPLSRGGSPFAQNAMQHDLISFDSFSTPADLLTPHPTASTSFIPPQVYNPSVDELLSSWSPSARDLPAVTVSPPARSEVDNASPKGKARNSDETTPEAAEEQAVVDALIFPEATDSATSPSPQDSTANVDGQPMDEDAPRTPLRRSTRPRRSGTPHAHLVPLPSSDDDDSPTRGPSTPSSALTRKKPRKGKERDVTLANENSDSRSSEALAGMDVPMSSEDGREPKRRKERGERKQASATGTPHTLQRQLGSLSPSSASLLTQLLPPSRPSPVREQEEPQQPAFSFSVFPVVNPTPTTVRMPSPIRASPTRNAKPRSPNRIQFQASTLNDPNRTPARRIPVEQAVARGQISPQKGAQLLTNTTDAGPAYRAPVFHIPPQDSPARRVNAAIPPLGQGKYQGMRFGSPTRGKSRERSGSVEPRPPWNGSAVAGPSDLGASASKSRSSPSRSTSAPIKKGKLPFPLTPSTSDPPLQISEPPDADPPDQPTLPPLSPVLSIIKVPRSNLKQPTSRIPRIGTKPYARPAAKPASDQSGTGPAATTRKVSETARAPPSKTIKVAKKGSSDDTKPAEAGPSNLKRKRAPSPQTKTRPVVLLRQVAPTRYAPPKPVPVQAPPSPLKRPAVAKFRMVDLHARPNAVVEAVEAKVPDPTPVVEPVQEQLDAPSSPILPPLEMSSDPAPQPASSPPPEASEPEAGSVRRTTRLRKSVFPSVAGLAQPLPTRRKASGQQPPAGSGAFAGMTAVALKALTSSNTTKNQKYLAAKLETEVVRKEGARPESPAVKIRTIAQREQEERGTQRKARAARRARRSDDGWSDAEDGADSSAADGDGFSDDDMESLPARRRHRRGPGDEEDYETPKVGKRARSGSASGEDGRAEKKRVKWHQGLSTTVFLDEVEPRSRVHPKENLHMKGCLTPAAKALRLDPLGNHPNAESPLKDLVEENIVVKKFVYDNDEPVLPVIVVKNTRSKAKKKS